MCFTGTEHDDSAHPVASNIPGDSGAREDGSGVD